MNATAEGMNRDPQRQRSVPKVSALKEVETALARRHPPRPSRQAGRRSPYAGARNELTQAVCVLGAAMREHLRGTRRFLLYQPPKGLWPRRAVLEVSR